MHTAFDDNAQSIGRTPLVKLRRMCAGAKASVLVKLESRNPAGSVKCRIGASMIWDAEERGVLGPGKTIIEPTSGNTGIALAYVGAARGYRVVLVMPESMSVERRAMFRIFGAELVLTPASGGMPGAIARVEELIADEPDKWVYLNQFENESNPRIHQTTTGPEILEQAGGRVDVLVSGVGTGGTITGVSRFIKQDRGLPLVSVAVEPEKSPVITQTLKGEQPRPGPHKIQGIGAGFVPKVLDLSLVDRVERVTEEESVEAARRLASEEGISAGISAGSAAAVALRLAREDEFEGKTIVAVLPDAADRYLSTVLFDGLTG